MFLHPQWKGWSLRESSFLFCTNTNLSVALTEETQPFLLSVWPKGAFPITVLPLSSALGLFPMRPSGSHPPVTICSYPRRHTETGSHNSQSRGPTVTDKAKALQPGAGAEEKQGPLTCEITHVHTIVRKGNQSNAWSAL